MPYTIIDRDRLVIIGTVSTATIAAQIEMVYYKETPTIVVNPGEGKSLSQLDEVELKMLLKGLAIPVDGQDYKTLMGYLKYYCENLPIQDPNQQSLDYIQGIMRNEVLAPPAEDPTKSVEKKAREPRAEGSAPSPKGSTGRVWAIADEQLQRHHNGVIEGVNLKDLRRVVIEACTDAGIHEATAATQWSKWKKSKGV